MVCKAQQSGGFGDSNEFNLKGAAALVTKCAGMGQQGVGVGGSTGVGAGGVRGGQEGLE